MRGGDYIEFLQFNLQMLFANTSKTEYLKEKKLCKAYVKSAEPSFLL